MLLRPKASCQYIIDQISQLFALDLSRTSLYDGPVAKRALIIYNPAARGAPRLERLREALGGLPGWDLPLESTGGPGDATRLAGQAAEAGFEAVVACGGDGTVNEAANGLAGSQTALAVVRGGTANVWAKEARIPRKREAALRLLEDGEVRAVDLGRAGDRYFLLMAGAGFDAAIVRELSAGAKRRLGAASYLIAGLRRAFHHRPQQVELTANGGTLSGDLYWCMLGNTRNYGGVLNITHMARVDDGLLDLCLLRKGGVLRLGWFAFWVLLQRQQRRAHVVYQQGRSFEIKTPGLPVQVDGEYLGETPLRFEVAPGALRVVVPRGRRSAVFASDSAAE